MKNRLFIGMICVAMLLSLMGLVGCETTGRDPRGDGVLTVVSTTFAGYDFARQILGDAMSGAVELILLGKPGQDMHDYEPTAEDIITLTEADVLVCLGGTAERWLDATVQSSGNTTLVRVEMMAVCETMAETPTAGMDHTGHDHAAGESCDHTGLIGADEHVWLAPGNAIAVAEAIGAALIEVDSASADKWTKNTAAYVAELTTLRDEFAAMRAAAVRDSILIADRYPFAYLVRELNVTAYAAFPGCSSETSASFATQTFLIEKTKELGLPYIFVIDGSDGRVAEVVAAESGAEVLTLDSIQVVSDRQNTYVGMMRKNLEALQKALC